MASLDVALVQMRSGTDVAANVADAEALITDAARNGARYIQTPEMTGLVQRDRTALFASVFAEADDPLAKAASALAARHRCHVHIGSTPILVGDGRIANRAFLFGPDGELVARYDKLHLFDVDLANGESWRESAIYDAGDCARTAKVGAATLGFGICYDLRFPALFAELALAGADILTAPAAFTRQTGEAHWHVLARARAIETGSFFLAAAQGGLHRDGRETYGHSIIVDPWGRVVAEKADAEPGLVAASLDLSAAADARAKIPNLRHRRDFRIETSGADG